MYLLKGCLCLISLAYLTPVVTNPLHTNGFINLEECENCEEIYFKDWGEPHECSEKETGK